ncbi:MAG: zinc ribbon domain-containing protein [Candidatus Lokiarchaeota archaeon]|nr:zinc ribbon domain-containing protein [Candidatus Lokiarchaeota archaeon]
MQRSRETKQAGTAKRGAIEFENGRKLHVGIGITTTISSLANLVYIVASTGKVMTSTPLDPLLVMMPATWLGACIAVAWGVSVHQVIHQPPRGNYMPRMIVKWAGSIAVAIAISVVGSILSLVASGPDSPVAQGLSIYSIVAGIVLMGACCVGLHGAAELRDPEEKKAPRPAEELNAPMPVKVLFRRAFTFCRRTYGTILVLLLAAAAIARVIHVLALSSWQASLLAEEQSLIAWLMHNNFVAGMEPPADIANRVALLYNMNEVFTYVQDVIKSCFYYAMLGIGITLIMKAYDGSNSRASEILRVTRRQLGPLILVSILFSLCYNLGLKFLFVPGLIFYVYCIFAFPNLLYVGKYKALQNFGEAKNRVSGNFARATLYGTFLYFMQFGYQLALQLVIDAVMQGMGGRDVVAGWRIDPYANIGNILLLEFLTGSLLVLIAPVEAAFIAMLFFDLAARKRQKMVEGMKSSSAKSRVQSLSSTTIADRTRKANYCPRCGLSVRKGITRCPNCKADVPPGTP